MINIVITFRIIQNHIMISSKLIPYSFGTFYCTSFPYDLITKIFLSKNFI